MVDGKTMIPTGAGVLHFLADKTLHVRMARSRRCAFVSVGSDVKVTIEIDSDGLLQFLVEADPGNEADHG